MIFLSTFSNLVLSNEKEKKVDVVDKKQLVINKSYGLYLSNKKDDAINLISSYLNKNEDKDLRLLKVAFMQNYKDINTTNRFLNDSLALYPSSCEFRLIKANENKNIKVALDVMLAEEVINDKEECLGFIGINYLKQDNLNEAKKYLNQAYEVSGNKKWDKLLTLISVKENLYQISPEDLNYLEIRN